MPVFELNRSQDIILRKISIFGQKMNFELDITPKWFFYRNFGFKNCFSTTKSFKKVLFENLKSARFRVKSLARHHFEENIHFWSKNEFWTGYYAKIENFFQNLGSIKCFSTTKNLKNVLFENSKSAPIRDKSLARHNFEEIIFFFQKNEFWTGYYAEMKTFFKIWAL